MANIGLELHLKDLLKADRDEKDGLRDRMSWDDKHLWYMECCDHVNDIVEACANAQYTLNDMLTYDKIESGMLLVEKRKLALIPFITSEARAFSIQVYGDFSVM